MFTEPLNSFVKIITSRWKNVSVSMKRSIKSLLNTSTNGMKLSTKERFESYFRNWLDGEFGIEEFIEQEQCVASTSASGTKRGRPSKPFLDLSERGKRRVIDKEAVDPKFDTIEKALLFARRTAYNRKDFNLVKVIGHI